MREKQVSYYLYGGHGNVRALLNEAGRITDKYRYNAYGELIEQNEDTENHYLYTGEYYDGTSNLYYLRARYMNPSTGNFLTMDTYEGSIYDPDTLHKYMYANGNPVTYSDPSGNSGLSIGETLIASACMAFLVCMPFIQYNFHRSIADAGIIPSNSYSLMNDIQETLFIQGICTITSLTLAIRAKVKGELEIYEADALDAVEEMDKGKEMYYVYFLENPKTHQIEYVGRTKNLKSRITAHKNSPNRSYLKLPGFVRMKDYAACRAVEQAAMLGVHTLKGEDGKACNNQINGVGINNGKAGTYYNAADRLWKAPDKVADYLLNQQDNERLNYIDKGMGTYKDYYSIY